MIFFISEREEEANKFLLKKMRRKPSTRVTMNYERGAENEKLQQK